MVVWGRGKIVTLFIYSVGFVRPKNRVEDGVFCLTKDAIFVLLFFGHYDLA
jgi:hypothetical protein